MHTLHDMELFRQELEMKFNKTNISVLTPYEPIIEIIKKIARQTKAKIHRFFVLIQRNATEYNQSVSAVDERYSGNWHNLRSFIL